jgi:predicted nuclease of predicted toxin-antitoxin system
MKFVVDAQLPKRLARFLQAAGHDTLHTSDLPQQNATPDSGINRLSMQQERIVITKDGDFVDSFLTIQQPYKLLLITTGNIKNSELEVLIADNLAAIIALLSQHSYIELSRDMIIVHQ